MALTKKQMLAECMRLAPDFRMAFERPGDVDTLVARFTDITGRPPLAIAMTLGAEGRSAIETRILGAALARLRAPR